MSTMNAIQIAVQGELSEIKMASVPVPTVDAGSVVYKVDYAGVNFIDTYQRSGIYKMATPFVLGQESSGIVTSVGEGVTGFKVGDKVAAYIGGGFAEYVKSPASKTAKLPEGMSTKDGATVLLQGLTALTMMVESFEVKKGQYILVQAAAGGLGLLLCQLAKYKGAHVIGTTSTAAKAKLALAAGAEHVILYDGSVDVVEEVYKITGGEGLDRGVHAVFDGVGKDTFDMAFKVVRRQGTIITCGNASGPVPDFSPLRLGAKNLKITRPVLGQAIYTAGEFHAYTTELFDLVKNGHLKLSRWTEEGYPFTAEGVKQSQIDIMSRKTTGKLVIKM